MPNAKDAQTDAFHRILLAGRTGSGKTAQLWTLPGRKFVYVFDPNSMRTLKGADLDFELFLPEFLEMDATLKGFNKGSKSDKPEAGSKKEPSLYMRWIDDINERVEKKQFNDYQWLCFDSFTFLTKAVMNRQLFINNRYGDIEELGDYRVVGSKLSEVFTSISSLPINIYATGHIDTFEDEKTKRINTELRLPGSARRQLPLMFTEIWKAQTTEGERGKKGEEGSLIYQVRTVPEPRGLQDIRSSMQGLKPEEDVTIKDFSKAESSGIGALLAKHGGN